MTSLAFYPQQRNVNLRTQQARQGRNPTDFLLPTLGYLDGIA